MTIRWLAGAMPDLQLLSLTDAELEQMLPEVCNGLRSIDELRTAGYFRDPEALTNLKTVPGLESLHERADYKAVVSEAEKR